MLRRYTGTNQLLILLDNLKQDQTIAIPYCYFSCRDERESCNLVGFYDASRQAYVAVVYLRIQTTRIFHEV